jgi:hypothetical protein
MLITFEEVLTLKQIHLYIMMQQFVRFSASYKIQEKERLLYYMIYRQNLYH